ncbi:hypothetical protein N665_1294s0001 [Sinapis alba]|nr:hypothetical protein N665_1294s0001 [Sinapis alba]
MTGCHSLLLILFSLHLFLQARKSLSVLTAKMLTDLL